MSVFTRIFNYLIGDDLVEKMNAVEVIRVKSFFAVLSLCFMAHLAYMAVSLASSFSNSAIIHLSGLVYVFAILFMLRQRFSLSILVNLYIGYLLMFMLINNLFVDGNYIRTMPWWGVFVIVIALISDTKKKVYVWTFLFYLVIMTVLYAQRDELFHHAYLTATMALFVYSFIVVHYMTQKQKLVTQLTNAIQEIKTLQGILPICANCKKIRNDEGIWNRLESYITQHSEAEFTHSCCPDCIRELYPEIADEVLAEIN